MSDIAIVTLVNVCKCSINLIIDVLTVLGDWCQEGGS
jgi:hypothetical protein